MKKINFEWDSNKEQSNVKKHHVTFDEASSTFYDEYALQFYDPEHSEAVDRFILLGTSFKLNAIVVCHCYRENEKTVRIISARKADKDEAKTYWSERS